MNANLTQFEEREVQKLPPLTKAIINNALKHNYSIDELFNFIEELKRVERPIRRELKDRISAIGLKKYEKLQKDFFYTGTNIHDFFNNIQENERIKNIPIVKKFISLIKDYCTFQEYAFSVVGETLYFDLVLNKLRDLRKYWQSYDMNREYTIHTIRILEFKMAQQEKFASRLFSIALDPRFSDEPEIYNRQINLVRDSYGAKLKPYKEEKIKKICYDFIVKSFSFSLGPSGALIDYLFLGDWISELTLRTLIENREELKAAGLNSLIFRKTEKLYESILARQELSEIDKNIITLYKAFLPEK